MEEGLANNLRELFLEGNKNFLRKHYLLLKQEVGERTLCGALMLELARIFNDSWYFDYFVDIEYNRNHDMIKQLPKKYISEDFTEEQQRIFPDIIVHSRGQRELDNLLVIEMKKADACEEWKNIDRKRLRTMTAHEGVFKYRLGIFYVVNFARKQVIVEYYVDGKYINAEYVCLML